MEMKSASKNQQVFQQMVLGTLLYAVVLGFFADYTSFLYSRSYSTTFAAAMLMQLLTFGTFKFKDVVVTWLKAQFGASKFVIGFCIWLIMFVSKFVFLEVIDIALGLNIQVSGFIGLLLIIICVTVLQKLVELGYKLLAD